MRSVDAQRGTQTATFPRGRLAKATATFLHHQRTG